MRYFAPTQLSENIKETPEGFLVCLGVPIARTGWQTYAEGEIEKDPVEPDDDGKILIYRDPAEVFSPVTMASFEGKAFTIHHPMQWVDPTNWRDLAKGILQNVRKASDKDDDGEESLLADVMITDSVAIRLVKGGMRAVSCGYESGYRQIEKGKAKQINIVGNHLALVQAGRAGPSYAIHDHKMERLTGMSKFAEKLKQFFNSAVDEAVEESEKDKSTPTVPLTSPALPKSRTSDEGKEDKKDDKKEDKKEEKKDDKKAEDKKSGDSMGSMPGVTTYDDLVTMVKDLSSKMSSKDEASGSMEARLKKCEDALAKLMGEEAEEEGSDVGDDSHEEESEEEKQVGDSKEDEDKKDSKTGDTASRAEILSPGIAITDDVKERALKDVYKTADGKETIDVLTGGKEPDYSSPEKIDQLFLSASEVLKARRGTGLERTKDMTKFDSEMDKAGKTTRGMTPDEMNEINKKFYNK